MCVAELPDLYKHVDRVIWLVQNIDKIKPAWVALGLSDVKEYSNIEFSGEYHGKLSSTESRGNAKGPLLTRPFCLSSTRSLIPIMVSNDRPTCKDRQAAELIMARSTRLHQKAEYIAADLSLIQTLPCSHAANHTLSVRSRYPTSGLVSSHPD